MSTELNKERRHQCQNLWFNCFQKLAETSSPVHKGQAVKSLIPRSINKERFIGTLNTVIRCEAAAAHDAKSTTFIESRKIKAK